MLVSVTQCLTLCSFTNSCFCSVRSLTLCYNSYQLKFPYSEVLQIHVTKSPLSYNIWLICIFHNSNFRRTSENTNRDKKKGESRQSIKTICSQTLAQELLLHQPLSYCCTCCMYRERYLTCHHLCPPAEQKWTPPIYLHRAFPVGILGHAISRQSCLVLY